MVLFELLYKGKTTVIYWFVPEDAIKVERCMLTAMVLPRLRVCAGLSKSLHIVYMLWARRRSIVSSYVCQGSSLNA